MSFSRCTVKPLPKLVSILLIVGLSFCVPGGLLAQSVLVAGGQVSSSLSTNTAEVYNPLTATWNPTANNITYDPPADAGGLCNPNMTLLGNGQVLIAGGGCSDRYETTNAASLYDPSANQWAATPFMNYGRDQFGMVTLKGGDALAFAGCAGGCIGPNILGQYFKPGWGGSTYVGDSAEIYGVASGQWTTVALLTTYRGNLAQGNQFQSAIELQDGTVLTCGGSDGISQYYYTCEIYNPVSNTWISTGSLPEKGGHRFVLLPNGNVLTVLNDGLTAMLFVPSSGIWTSTGSLTSIQIGGDLVALSDGQVLDCGGTDAQSNPLNTAQIYNPTSGQWSTANSMGTSRQGHIAVRLADGRVLAAGGWTVGSVILSAAEIFDPSSRTWVSTSSMTQARAYPQALLLGQAGPYAYVANYNNNSVSMINIPASPLMNTIQVGSGPWGIAISPDQKQVYVTNSQGGNVSVIDTASNTQINAVTVGSTPLGLAFTPPNGNQVYVANEGSNSVSVIDTASQTVVATVQNQGLNSPVGVAMAYTNLGTFAYVSNSGTNTVSVIDVGPNPKVNQKIQVGTGPRWVAATPDSRLVYVENAGSKNISVISVANNNQVVATIPINASPYGVAFTPDSKFAYVADNDTNTVSVIYTASIPPTVIATLSGFTQPTQVAMSFDGAFAYVTNANDTVSVIETASNTIIANVQSGSTPVGVAIAVAPQTELQITQPLSPTQPNNFDFPANTYAVQYPPGTKFANVTMTVTEVPITQAEFQQLVADTAFAGVSCIVYGGTGGNCVDDQVTCNPSPCPSESQPTIDVETDFTTVQSIVNPGYISSPIGQNQWTNIFSELDQVGPLIKVKGKTSGFSEFVAVDLGAQNPQGQALFTLLSPQFPVTYSNGQAIPISIQLMSVVPPNPPVTDGQASISVTMIADGNGNPTQQIVFSLASAFQQQGSSGIYDYTLDATAYAAGVYVVSIYGNAFPSYQGQFTIQGSGAASTTTGLTSSLNPSRYNQTIALMATVSSSSGTPTGNVTFYDGGTQIGSAALTNGTAQLSIATLTGGTHYLNAYYPGSQFFFASTSPVLVQKVAPGGVVSNKLTSSQNPSYVGQDVTFTAVVLGTQATPTGTVTFKQGSQILGTAPLVNGQATFATSFTEAGTLSIFGDYSGDQNYLPKASKALKQVVQKYSTTTSLTSSPNPSQQGQPVTFTATVSSAGPVPTGKVTFYNGSKSLGTGKLVNGVATLTTTKLAKGNLSITATYSGDAANNKSTSPVLIQVVQ